MTRPRGAERATLAGHLPAETEEQLLAELRARYPQWAISSTPNGGLIADHRTEELDERTERGGVTTTVYAPTAERMMQRLRAQAALRGDGAEPER